MEKLVIVDGESYKDWITEISNEFKRSQIRAAVKINDEMFTLKSLMDKVEILVKEKLAQDNLITISQLRDALNTSRKSAKPMLEYLDNMKITRKNGTESERVGY